MIKKIYTCGRMSGIDYSKQMSWRRELESCVRHLDNNVYFIHPPLFYNYEVQNHKSEKEILDWEIMKLHECDIVVVNLEDIDKTTGSHIELGAIQGINRFSDKYIYVVGIGNADNIHPWIKETCNRIESDIESAAEYIAGYLLV